MTTYRGASTAAIQRHYDLSDDFFALWLDERRIYSCAMWSPDSTLEQAQLAKLDYHIAGARAAGKDRVLDVGCGWGALLSHMTEVHAVDHAVGLTLSQAQFDYVNAAGDDSVDVRLENWTQHVPERPYDAIISIGAFEHFADYGMSRAERIDAYRRFFSRCNEWLLKGGRLALQTIIKGNNTTMSRTTVNDLLFIIDKIFNESELPWLSEILEASERFFDPVSIRNDAADYAWTCAVWRHRLNEQREAAEAMVGAEIVADYLRYLTAARDAFAQHHTGLVRTVFERI